MNLLGPDVLAEVTLHLTADNKRKAVISKLDDDTAGTLRQMLVQALLFTAIDIAKERAVGINWAAVAALYPFTGPPPPQS